MASSLCSACSRVAARALGDVPNGALIADQIDAEVQAAFVLMETVEAGSRVDRHTAIEQLALLVGTETFDLPDVIAASVAAGVRDATQRLGLGATEANQLERRLVAAVSEFDRRIEELTADAQL
jgi:hypothetical protein